MITDKLSIIGNKILTKHLGRKLNTVASLSRI